MIGKMDERVSIQESSEADDGYGVTLTWANIATDPTVWAEVKPVKGREYEDRGRLATMETYLVRIRYRTDVTTANKLVWGSKELDIRHVADREMKGQYLWLECEHGGTQ